MKMAEKKYRINKTTAGMMLILAIFFDLAQMGAKILLVGSAVFVGAVAGELLGVGSGVGSLVGAVVSFIPFIGQAITLSLGMALSWVFSATLATLGYLVLWFWFAFRGEFILSGRHISGKVFTFFYNFGNGIITSFKYCPRYHILDVANDLIFEKSRSGQRKNGIGEEC